MTNLSRILMSDKNHREIEVKLRLQNVDSLLQAGIRLELDLARHFEDNWLLDAPSSLLGEREAILRVRSAGGKGVLTYKEKTPATEALSQFKQRIEIETPIDDPENVLLIFERLGYQKWFRYQKYRTVYQAQLPSGAQLHVMFDETPIGNFIELEGAEESITEAIALLGLSPREYILESYLALQLAHCEQMGKAMEDLVF